jgi:hypothetical protein
MYVQEWSKGRPRKLYDGTDVPGLNVAHELG